MPGSQIEPLAPQGLQKDELTISAIEFLATYRSADGRRLHPDDTLRMILNLIEARRVD